MDAKQTNKTLCEFIERVQKGQSLVLLAGAGISATAGIRTGEQLLRCLRDEKPDLFSESEPLTYSEVFERAIPEPEDRRGRIEKECRGHLPQNEHLWVAQLLYHRRLRAVITTNFDHLIEHALMNLGCEGIPIVLSEDEIHPSLLHPATPPIVKIHGDFLFDDIANLEEELREKLKKQMRDAMLQLTKGADLLILGYSGGDRTVVDLIGEMVCETSTSAPRVWWSLYFDERPDNGPFRAELVKRAERALNPIRWLGPWSASTCLEVLGETLGVPTPSPTPFGISGSAIAPPTHFSRPLQTLPGEERERDNALAHHSLLRTWASQGGAALVLQLPGAGGSTLLAAVSEAAKDLGLYFDTRFAFRPVHLDLQGHLRALSAQMGVLPEFLELFRKGAVVVVDGIALRSAGKYQWCWERNFAKILRELFEAQQFAGRGFLLLGTHFSQDQLGAWDSPLFLANLKERTYLLRESAQARRQSGRPPPEVEPLLEVLSRTTTAIPLNVASRAARMGTSVNWNAIDPWVERRGDRVALRETVRSARRADSPRDLTAIQIRLANTLLESTAEIHPLRTLGYALEAEDLYFMSGQPANALSAFLPVAERGLLSTVTRDYFLSTLRDHVEILRRNPKPMQDVPTDLAAILAMLHSELKHEPGGEYLEYETAVEAACVGKNTLDQTVIRWWAKHPQIPRDQSVRAYARSLREEVSSLQILLKQASSHAPCESKARLALLISSLWDDLGDMRLRLDGRREATEAYERSLSFAVVSREQAALAEARDLVGKARDHEVRELLRLERLDDAERVLEARLEDLGKRQGFSADKAVALSNCFQLELRRGDIRRAEAYFYEAFLQGVVLLRWRGLDGNLTVLRDLAQADARLPSHGLIEKTRKETLRAATKIWAY